MSLKSGFRVFPSRGISEELLLVDVARLGGNERLWSVFVSVAVAGWVSFIPDSYVFAFVWRLFRRILRYYWDHLCTHFRWLATPYFSQLPPFGGAAISICVHPHFVKHGLRGQCLIDFVFQGALKCVCHRVPDENVQGEVRNVG